MWGLYICNRQGSYTPSIDSVVFLQPRHLKVPEQAAAAFENKEEYTQLLLSLGVCTTDTWFRISNKIPFKMQNW